MGMWRTVSDWSVVVSCWRLFWSCQLLITEMDELMVVQLLEAATPSKKVPFRVVFLAICLSFIHSFILSFSPFFFWSFFFFFGTLFTFSFCCSELTLKMSDLDRILFRGIVSTSVSNPGWSTLRILCTFLMWIWWIGTWCWMDPSRLKWLCLGYLFLIPSCMAE